MDSRVVNKIIAWIREEVKNARKDGVVLGISGGLDSSCCAVLCKKAFPKKHLALFLNCHSSMDDEKDAEIIAKKFRLNFRKLNITSVCDSLVNLLNTVSYKQEVKNDEKNIGNVKSRLRMVCLYYFANRLNYLVVGTSNKTELLTGYFTKYGDGASDILPLGGLYKTEVKELAKMLRIPDGIVSKPPSAGLWKGQTDEKELEITYKELDTILSKNFKGGKFHLPKGKNLSENYKKVCELYQRSQHKRSLPKIFSE